MEALIRHNLLASDSAGRTLLALSPGAVRPAQAPAAPAATNRTRHSATEGHSARLTRPRPRPASPAQRARSPSAAGPRPSPSPGRTLDDIEASHHKAASAALAAAQGASAAPPPPEHSTLPHESIPSGARVERARLFAPALPCLASAAASLEGLEARLTYLPKYPPTGARAAAALPPCLRGPLLPPSPAAARPNAPTLGPEPCSTLSPNPTPQARRTSPPSRRLRPPRPPRPRASTRWSGGC